MKTIHGSVTYNDIPGRTDFLFRLSLKAVILNSEGHVLVVKETGRDWWDIPGGGMDHGESIQTALARELREEVSLYEDCAFEPIVIEDPVYLQTHNWYQVRCVFLVHTYQREFSTGDDADEVAFMDPELFKSSQLVNEQRIYDYVRLATKRTG